MFCCGAPEVRDADGFILIGSLSSIPNNGSKKFSVSKKSLAVFRREKKVYAMENPCSHQGVGLAGEDIEDIDGKMCVVCPGHGYNFNLKTGKCTNFPEYQQKTFKCKVLEEDVWVLV